MENKEDNQYKYVCDNCNYKCNEISKWEKHINTEKHKTGKNKTRSDYDGPYICYKCNYETKNKSMFTQHNLNYHATREEREKQFKHYCKVCDFGTISKDIYDKHILTEKHKKKSTL